MVLSQQLNNCCLLAAYWSVKFCPGTARPRTCCRPHCTGVLAFIALESPLALRWLFALYALTLLPQSRWLLSHCHADRGRFCFCSAGIAEGSFSSSQNPRRNNPRGLDSRVRLLPTNQVRNCTRRRRGRLGPRLSCQNWCRDHSPRFPPVRNYTRHCKGRPGPRSSCRP